MSKLALVESARPAELRERPGYNRVPCPPGATHVLQRHHVGELARAQYLRAVVAHHHADVVAAVRVVAVGHGVDQTLEPGELRVIGNGLELAIVPQAARKLLCSAMGLGGNMRSRAVERCRADASGYPKSSNAKLC